MYMYYFFYLKCQVTLSQLGTKLGLVSKAVSKKLKAEKYRAEKLKKRKEKTKVAFVIAVFTVQKF